MIGLPTHTAHRAANWPRRHPGRTLWIKGESLEDSASLPDPDVLAAEILEDLQDALEQSSGIVAALGGGKSSSAKA